MKKWLGIFIRNKYLCSQVNAGVHRTYSMSCTSVNRPNKRVEVESILHLFIGKALDTLASRASLSVTSSLSNEANTNLIAHNNDRLPLRTSSLSEETKTNLIAHNNSGISNISRTSCENSIYALICISKFC